jgi:hypothetical protein
MPAGAKTDPHETVKDAEVLAASRVLTAWGGMKDRNADQWEIIRTMIARAKEAAL